MNRNLITDELIKDFLKIVQINGLKRAKETFLINLNLKSNDNLPLNILKKNFQIEEKNKYNNHLKKLNLEQFNSNYQKGNLNVVEQQNIMADNVKIGDGINDKTLNNNLIDFSHDVEMSRSYSKLSHQDSITSSKKNSDNKSVKANEIFILENDKQTEKSKLIIPKPKRKNSLKGGEIINLNLGIDEQNKETLSPKKKTHFKIPSDPEKEKDKEKSPIERNLDRRFTTTVDDKVLDKNETKNINYFVKKRGQDDNIYMRDDNQASLGDKFFKNANKALADNPLRGYGMGGMYSSSENPYKNLNNLKEKLLRIGDIIIIRYNEKFDNGYNYESILTPELMISKHIFCNQTNTSSEKGNSIYKRALFKIENSQSYIKQNQLELVKKEIVSKKIVNSIENMIKIEELQKKANEEKKEMNQNINLIFQTKLLMGKCFNLKIYLQMNYLWLKKILFLQSNLVV